MADIIYQPKGKAGEYAGYAFNLFVGCSHLCSYCYCKSGILAKALGGNHPTLKKCFGGRKDIAVQWFKIEIEQFRTVILANGGEIFSSFTTDPMQPETIDLTMECAKIAVEAGIKVVLLTKAAGWSIDPFIAAHPESFKIGFTLTGHDEMEPGASPNAERIQKMKEVHELGVGTFASIEPIIDFASSLEMIKQAAPYCDEFKLGLMSGFPAPVYNLSEGLNFLTEVEVLQAEFGFELMLKDSIKKFVGID